MKRIWLFPLMTVALWAQNPLYLDLSGDWRTILADDLAYARPDFDDSGWSTYRLPSPDRGTAISTEDRWLRRSLVIPSGQKTDDLVLTIGGFRRKYEVFVNGVRIGEKSEATAPTAKMFPVPPRIFRSGETNLIALRVQAAARTVGVLGVLPNAGPFLLTHQVNAPIWVTAADHERRTRYATLSLALALLYSMLGLLLFLAWLGSRGDHGLAALAGALGMEAEQRFVEYYAAFTGAGTTPLLAGFPFQASASLLVFTLLDQLRIDRRVCGAAALLSFGAFQVGGILLGILLGQVALYGALLFGIAWLVYRWGRLSGRRGAALTLLSVVFLFTTRIPGTGLQVFSGSSMIGGFYIRFFDCAFVGLGVVLVILLMRRLIEDRREKQRLASELEAARAVQQLMLPASGVARAGFALDAVYEPATEVGGDFHWSRTDADGSLIAVVGDVSGKGLKAAMLVSVAIGALRREKSPSPAEILAGLNEVLLGQGGFVTCCCIRYAAGGELVVASAGHPAPYGEGREVEVVAGLPLGVMADASWQETRSILPPGAQVTLVSDGVVEAENARRELFGFERTREISGGSAREIAEAARTWGQNDDITVVTVRRMTA